MKRAPSRCASDSPTVVLPAPATPIRITIIGAVISGFRRPVDVMVARPVQPLDAVGAEIITLRLDEIGARARGPHPVGPRQRRGECGNCGPVSNRRRHRPPPAPPPPTKLCR